MRSVRLLAVAVLVVVLLSCLGQNVVAATELYYDDGFSEYGITTGVVGTRYAVRFSLPSGWSAANLVGVKFYIKMPGSATVRIYGSLTEGCNGLQLDSFTMNFIMESWNEQMGLSGITVTGDFCVAAEITAPYAPAIGLDTIFGSEVDPQRSWEYSPSTGTWEHLVNPAGEPATLMIRAWVETLPVTTVSTYYSATTSTTTLTTESTATTVIETENPYLTTTTTMSSVRNPTNTRTLTTITVTSGSKATTYTTSITHTTSYTRSTTTELLRSESSTYTTEYSTEGIADELTTTKTITSATSTTSGGTVYVTKYVTFKALEKWVEFVRERVRVFITEVYEVLFELKIDPTVDETIVEVTPTSTTTTTGTPVGGEVYSVNRLQVLMPYLALLGVVAVAAVVAYSKRDD